MGIHSDFTNLDGSTSRFHKSGCESIDIPRIWKESHPDHSRIGEYRWHIGGKEHRAVELVYEALGK